MKAIEVILLPFVFVYKGFISVLLIPYYFVLGIVKLFELMFGRKNKEDKKVIPELKKGEKVKVVKTVRSAYDKPNVPPKETDPVVLKKQKDEKTARRQQEFERLVKKARQEELKRIKEQERIRIEREKKEAEKEKRELAIKKREEELEAKRQAKEDALRKKGEPVTFYEKLRAFYKKLTFNKKEALELEAKKTVLDEQFKDKKNNASRFEKPLIFNYVAKNPAGEIEKSSIEALSRVDVHSFLLAEGYEVYDISVAKTTASITIGGTHKIKRNRLIFYLSQLSAYLKAGIALAAAVKILDEQAGNKHEKKVWRAVYYDLSMGDVLSVAMEK